MNARLRMERVLCVTAALMLVSMLSACEKPPAPAPPAAPAATGTPKSDVEAMRQFADQKSRRGTAANPQLPPGHPPVEGGAPPPAPPNGPQLPAGHPPTNAAGAVPAARSGQGSPSVLKFDPPAEWRSVPPPSAMRKAQYVLPRVEGDELDGELIVYYFGPGEGGGVRDNLERWKGMFHGPDGKRVADDAVREESFEANGLKVTWLDISGQYAPAPMAGGADTTPRDKFRMLAAVVETSGGPWFFKAIGPQATLEKHRTGFKTLLESSRE
ncbi:MAG: hypothetical protein CHACPFDD_03604 [Phycisphaerae bacterium]|nr:hypothetical protein [Phycisphaerae bacterium]